MKQALVLTTEREGLILRELTTEADDQVYFDTVREAPEHVDNYENAVASKYDTLEKVRDRRLTAGADIRLGIWDGDEFKGSISARFEDEDQTEAEIGYWLRESAIGNGYATLAVKALTAYVRPRFSRVFAEVNINNKPSLKVMERAGYIKQCEDYRPWGRAAIFEPGK